MITEDRLITAMITPFQKNGDVDYDVAKNLAVALSKSGSDGILIGGTTGESPTLSDEEKPDHRPLRHCPLPLAKQDRGLWC